MTLEFFFHIDKYLANIIQNFGAWSYLLLFAVVFAETGLVVTPFLPGDSLLLAAGTFAAVGAFDGLLLSAALAAAAIAGDSVNYALGKAFGAKVLQHKNSFRFIKKEHLDRTHAFYKKHGGKAIVLARFIPIIRTFAPFVAGIVKMDYRYFFFYNIAGAVLWVSLFIGAGFLFGNIPFINHNFSLVILAIIILSLLPVAIEYRRQHNQAGGQAGDRG